MVISSSLSSIVVPSVIIDKSSSVVVGIAIVVVFGDDVNCGFLAGKRVVSETVGGLTVDDGEAELVYEVVDESVVFIDSLRRVDDDTGITLEIRIHSGGFFVASIGNHLITNISINVNIKWMIIYDYLLIPVWDQVTKSGNGLFVVTVVIDVLCVVMLGDFVGAIVPLLVILIGVLKVVTFFVLVDTVGSTMEIKNICFHPLPTLTNQCKQPMDANHKPFLIQNILSH